jgi:hypothetical protein
MLPPYSEKKHNTEGEKIKKSKIKEANTGTLFYQDLALLTSRGEK